MRLGGHGDRRQPRLLREAGLALGDVEAGANDLLVALDGEDEAALAAFWQAEAELQPRARGGAGRGSGRGGWRRRASMMALGELPTANLALISTSATMPPPRR